MIFVSATECPLDIVSGSHKPKPHCRLQELYMWNTLKKQEDTMGWEIKKGQEKMATISLLLFLKSCYFLRSSLSLRNEQVDNTLAYF